MNRRTFYCISLALLLQSLSAIHGWSPPFRVSPYSSNDICSAVCVDGEGRVLVTWFNPYRLYSRIYDGSVWSKAMLVDSTRTIYGAAVRSSSMCRDSLGQVWATWVDSAGHIRLSHFDDQEWTWYTATLDERIRGAGPGITCDGSNNIWCSWTGFTTMVDSNFYIVAGCYDRSSWIQFDTLAIVPPLISHQTTGITTDVSGNIWICWNGDPDITGDFKVYVQYFDGMNWSVPESVGVCDDMAFPAISADNSGNIWVAWYWYSGSIQMDGKMCVRHADGDTWSEIQFPHSDTTHAPWPHPDICSDPQGRIWLGWAEARHYQWDTVRVCGAHYEDGNWEDLTIIDSVASPYGDLVDPVIAYGADMVWLVWTSVKAGNSDIYLSHVSATGIIEQVETRNERLRLHVYPNPFSRRTDIRCCMDTKHASSLKIYDLNGRLIKTFVILDHQSPTTKIFWDGRDEKGKRVQSGVYFIRLQTGKEATTTKLVLLH